MSYKSRNLNEKINKQNNYADISIIFSPFINKYLHLTFKKFNFKKFLIIFF